MSWLVFRLKTGSKAQNEVNAQKEAMICAEILLKITSDVLVLLAAFRQTSRALETIMKMKLK